ncbi:hypothetical protein 1 [Sanxia tombus-like virus 8]|uniref:hypothetical protein 1 n=1 Tax=Sanxia tombus-like virus 8 TaxID=1923392 RepID=UPI00090A1791|nr:hypothetical protein 1 [Sanxia tombus-like virus 8]APG76414.1 hypothetical protein 1 [Sanxia tombus-like virus 8]
MEAIRNIYRHVAGAGPPPETDDTNLMESLEQLLNANTTLNSTTIESYKKVLGTVRDLTTICASLPTAATNTILDERLRAETLTQQIAGIQHGDRNEQTAEKIELERLKAKVKALEEQQILNDRARPPSIDEALAFLKIKCLGKTVDETYMAYCGSILREYLLQRAKVSTRLEYSIINGTMDMHMANIRPQYDYDLHNIMRYNDCVNFVQRSTVRVFNRIYTIPFTDICLKSLNYLRPVGATENINHPYRPRFAYLRNILLIISILTAAYNISPLFLGRMKHTTIPNAPQPPLQPMPTGINLSTWMNIGQNILTTSSHYASSSIDSAHGIMSSISTLWTAPASEDFISKLSTRFEMDEKSRVASLLSLSLRKWDQISTKLQDLSKHAIQHSISLMDATLNHSSVLTNTSYNSAKALMTRLEPKYTSFLENTNTTLKETIRLLTHTSPETCFEYAMNITEAAINRTTNFVDFAAKLSATRLEPVKVKITAWSERACQETLIPAMETALSTTTYSRNYLEYYGLKATRLLMETTLYSLRPVNWIVSNVNAYYENLIWKRRWERAQTISITLSFAAVALFITLMAIRQWLSIQTVYRRYTVQPTSRGRTNNIPGIFR